MIRIIFTDKENLHGLTKRILSEELSAPVTILQTSEGKPYIEGNPLYFSMSHSGNKGVVAIYDNPVGVDLENIKNKNYPATLSRFPAREQKEITSQEDFIRHWTAREAYIKMHGYTLASAFKHLEYFGGQIYFKNEKQPCEITHYKVGKSGILAICR